MLHIALVADLPWTYLLSHSIVLPPLSLVLSLTTLSSFNFERCSHTVVFSSSPANWLAQFGFSWNVGASVSVSFSRASLTLCEAGTCTTRSCLYGLHLRACTTCSIALLFLLWCVPLSISVLWWTVNRRHLAPLSATTHTIQATYSQCHTLLNSHNIARPPLLRCHLLQYRRSIVLLPQALSSSL